jgi:hypothetical protein
MTCAHAAQNGIAQLTSLIVEAPKKRLLPAFWKKFLCIMLG